MGADSGPAHHQFIVEGEFVRPQAGATRFTGLDIGQVETAMSEGRQVLVDGHRQRVGLAGLDQLGGVEYRVGIEQVQRTDFVIGAVL
ncbi:hypothetical protein D3C76_1394120 [compost metagenome]